MIIMHTQMKKNISYDNNAGRRVEAHSQCNNTTAVVNFIMLDFVCTLGLLYVPHLLSCVHKYQSRCVHCQNIGDDDDIRMCSIYPLPI